ncbi:hypothetical protein AB0D04_00605 [Streptomyces sp. NPDC048483]|uniref:hypothetical protein n=1 Tax=Streptomyces sp. NPDC048483 TaxID=3154927 RepID=UPI00342F109D
MFSRKKIVALSGLLGGLAMTYAGATQAYGGGSESDCTRSAVGNRVCVYKGQHIYKSKNGRYVIRQAKDCSTISRQRVLWPENGLLNSWGGTTKIGPVVNCSNTVHLPKGVKIPHFGH